jgi:hypothetical protein
VRAGRYSGVWTGQALTVSRVSKLGALTFAELTAKMVQCHKAVQDFDNLRLPGCFPRRRT